MVRPLQPRAPQAVEELVNPAHTALIVVDLQNDYCSPRGAFGRAGTDLSMMPPVIEQSARLIDAARESGVLVIWLQMTALRAGLSEAPSAVRSRDKYLAEARVVDGSFGQDFVEPLKPLPDEPVIKKLRSSGFVGTMLDLVLDANGIQTVVCIGVGTEGCVEATARSAAFHNYHPVLAEDCVASTRMDLHAQSMIVMRTRFDIVTSEHLAAWWRASSFKDTVRPGVARRQHRTLEEIVRPDHTALVVVDVQNDFCSPGGDYDVRGVDISTGRAIIPVVGDLVNSARQAGAMVIWLRALCLPDGLSDSPATQRFIGRHHDRPYILPGTWGQDIADGLAAAPGEPVIDKFRSEGFVGTPLHLLLDANDIHTVILTGVVTQGCVESTARGAVHHNYYVVCVEDAMATPNPVLHQAALAIMRQRYDVVTSGHLVAMWEGAMRTVGP